MSSLAHRLYHGETTFDFVGKRRIGFAISGALLLISLVSLLARGLNLGIDFEGGVAWEMPRGDVSVDDARAVLDDAGLDEPRVQTLSGAGGERIRIQVGPQDLETQREVQEQLAELGGVDSNDVSVNAVGPSWGREITEKAVRALVVFFVLIAIYISLRFEWKMAVGALAAVVHDIGISVGVYSIFGFEVTPATVIAFLTILGFSLYDTIVVFDKVHENTRRLLASGRGTYADMVNLSMNQVLMRSLNTTVAAVLPVLSLLIVGSWILGAIALQDFALALLVGLATGAYSSIFIATPILAVLKEREPRYRALRDRMARTGGPVPAAAAAVAGRGDGSARDRDAAEPGASTASRNVATRPVSRATTVAPSYPPRPRKKKRRT